jgi:DNA-binding MarR family transcriptional regulator
VTERQAIVSQLELEVGQLLRRVKRVLAERATLVHADLQPAAYLMLAHLAARGPARSSALSDVFSLDKGAVSRHVQQLVDLGLVARAPDPHDGRATILAATDEGRGRVEAVRAARRERLDQRLAEWSDDELRSFVSDLARYNRTLE